MAVAGPTEDETAVWQLEENYWKYVKEQDLDAYRALWDERFVGWPSFSLRPMGEKSISDWIPPLHQDAARVFDFELRREAVRSFGDIVVAHYLSKRIHRTRRRVRFLKKAVGAASPTPGNAAGTPGRS